MLDNLKEINNDDIASQETEAELDKRFAKIESVNFYSYSMEEIKAMLASKWRNK